MKRFFLLMSVIFVFAVCSAYAISENDIFINNFGYTDGSGEELKVLTAGGTVEAYAEVIASPEIPADSSLEAVTVLYDGDEIIEADVKKLSLLPGDTATVTLSVTVPLDAVKPSVATFFIDSTTALTPVYSPAYFGTEDTELYDIRINGEGLSVVPGVYSYGKSLKVGYDDIPYLPLYIPRDLSARISSSKEGTDIKLEVSALSGEKSEYKVSVPVVLPEVKVCKYGYRGANPGRPWEVKTDLKAPDAVLSNIKLDQRSATVEGWSYRMAMEFDIPEIPEGYEIDTAEFTFYAKTAGDVNLGIYSTASDWFNFSGNANHPVINFDEMISYDKQMITVLDEEGRQKGFGKYTFLIKPEYIKPGSSFSLTAAYDFVARYLVEFLGTDAEKLPVLNITLRERV